LLPFARIDDASPLRLRRRMRSWRLGWLATIVAGLIRCDGNEAPSTLGSTGAAGTSAVGSGVAGSTSSSGSNGATGGGTIGSSSGTGVSDDAGLDAGAGGAGGSGGAGGESREAGSDA